MYRHVIQVSTLLVLSLGSMTGSYASNNSVPAKPGFKYERDQQSDKLRMLRGQAGPVALTDNSQRPLHEKVANQFAPQFGINNPAQQLRVKKQNSISDKTSIRYQQLHQGLPVIGGELVANLNAQNQLLSMSGETATVQLRDATPSVSAEQAGRIAIEAVAKWYQLTAEQVTASAPVLSVYDPSLLVRTQSSSQLVWQLTITPNHVAPIHEYFLVDARTGGIVLHFNQVDSALDRATYTAGGTPSLPGSLVCDESTPANCASDADAQAAHDFAGDTYDFYSNTHGRDGIDGSGSTILSTVDWDDGFSCPNAFWSGTQMVYCDAFPLADDVVAHELTHGVTENTSDLLYYSESGAINESLSDVWGEFVDQTNGAGTDGPSRNWQIGEDAPTGVIRDMQNPELFSQPNDMTSPLFYTGDLDNGGVHINSGVNNKAAYLMVEGSSSEPGGDFNGQIITPIGITKTAHIYYYAQTNLLTTGSDYLDLYNALNAACTALIGSNGIIADDCTQVNNALLAVEMNQVPSAAYAPTATICPVGVNVYDLFFDDFEANNLSNWSVVNATGSSSWSTDTVNLSATTTGAYTAVGAGSSSGSVNDSALQLANAVRSPQSEIAYLHFDQAFYFERLLGVNYDGGLIEYSIDGGNTWLDANSLIVEGRSYTGELGGNNPETGRSAFTALSNGYNSTRLDLSSLGGEWVQFRFRNLADESVLSGPWSIDNFRVYLCADNAPPIPNAGPDQNVRSNETVNLSGTATDPDGDALTYQWTQVSGTSVTLSDPNSLTPSFTSPVSTSNLVFELSATSNGVTETDTVEITVNFFLSGNVSGGNSGCSLSEQGRFDPVWLVLLMLLAGLHLRNRKKPAG